MCWRQTLGKTLVVGLFGLGLIACSSQPQPVVVTEPEVIDIPEAEAGPQNGSIFQARAGQSPLFEDRRPRGPGDTLTVVLDEEVSASKNSEASASRQSSMGLDLENLPEAIEQLQEYGFEISAGNEFLGQGGASASNTFTGTITVSVHEVLRNGNLRVRGEKQIAINQGAEYIRFSGIVNPRNISGQNTVMSTEVAESRIEYVGDGYISEAQRMGWLQRLYNWIRPL